MSEHVTDRPSEELKYQPEIVTASEVKAAIEVLLRAGPPSWSRTAETDLISTMGQAIAEALEQRKSYELYGLWDRWRPHIAADWDEFAIIIRQGIENLTWQWHSYRQWKGEQDPEMLDVWPQRILFSVGAPKLPRGTRARWVAAGGKEHGPFKARASDPIWARFSQYAHPYPPFEWDAVTGYEVVME